MTHPDKEPQNENGPGLRRGPPPAMDSAGKQASIANEVTMTTSTRITRSLCRLVRRKRAPLPERRQVSLLRRLCRWIWKHQVPVDPSTGGAQ